MYTGVPVAGERRARLLRSAAAGGADRRERLRARGYATAFFGKWHLYRRDPGAQFVGQAHAKIVVPPAWRGGFEFWEGFESGFLLNDPWLHGTRLPEPVQFPGYQSDVVCARAGAAESGYRKPESMNQRTGHPVSGIQYPRSSGPGFAW